MEDLETQQVTLMLHPTPQIMVGDSALEIAVLLLLLQPQLLPLLGLTALLLKPMLLRLPMVEDLERARVPMPLHSPVVQVLAAQAPVQLLVRTRMRTPTETMQEVEEDLDSMNNGIMCKTVVLALDSGTGIKTLVKAANDLKYLQLIYFFRLN